MSWNSYVMDNNMLQNNDVLVCNRTGEFMFHAAVNLMQCSGGGGGILAWYQ